MSNNSSEDVRKEESHPTQQKGLSSLWSEPIISKYNLKCSNLPILNLNNQYSRNFHLSWLAFLVAFLSWFAFPPLMPEAIREDLHLSAAQVANSNIIALLATLLVRIVVGPLVDRFGPRKVMAALLILGAIPSGLAGTARTASHLYAIRFFIGILGGTFVPCQAWTTCFFDKNVVGTANALVGGWGNAGGGITFVVMIALFNRLRDDGLSSSTAWRAAFAIVPVPILLTVAAMCLVFGTDHPAGKWSQRHNVLGTKIAAARGHQPILDHAEVTVLSQHPLGDEKDKEKGDNTEVTVAGVTEDSPPEITSELDVAVNEKLTTKTAIAILTNPLTWLPSIAYLTTFGFELAIDASLANVLYALYKSKGMGQTKAGYLASVFGLLNIFTRPYGGYLGDVIYRRFGTVGKKYLTLACGFLQGAMSLGMGIYIEKKVQSGHSPSLAIVMVFIVLIAIFNEMGNGANFSLVPHCNPYSNGMMSGIVGAFGNLGGIFFGLVFRFQPSPQGKPWWICGIIIMILNVLLIPIPVPRR
ncbi:nitrate transporter [Serendipita vermifera]|nr:nitrate transporter [Serendipita vermifera]